MSSPPSTGPAHHDGQTGGRVGDLGDVNQADMSGPIETPSGVLWAALLLGSFLFIAAAVTLEVLAGEGAASSTATASPFIPLTWPQPLRVVWWLGAAAAAATFRASLHRLGFPARRPADIVTVVTFLIFATGIAFGADWATWH